MAERKATELLAVLLAIDVEPIEPDGLFALVAEAATLTERERRLLRTIGAVIEATAVIDARRMYDALLEAMRRADPTTPPETVQ